MGILSVLLLFTFDWYLLRLIVLLKPDYNCCNSFALSWVGKITTRTRSVVSVIANFSTPAESVITQVDEQVRMRLVSQLIKGISRVLQKLLKYFNGTAISTSFALSAAEFFPLFIPWIWMIQKVLKYHFSHRSSIVVNFQIFWNNYRYIVLNYTPASQHLDLLHYLLLMQSVNSAQFLNITSLFLLSPSFFYRSASVTVIVPSASMYASL